MADVTSTTARSTVPVRLLALLTTPVVAIAVLHHLGSAGWAAIDWSDLTGWATAARPEDALAAVLRLVSLAVAYWILGATLLTVLARRGRSRGLVGLSRAVTPAALRRLVERAVVGAAAAGLLAALVPGTPQTGAAHASVPPPLAAPAPPGLAPPASTAPVSDAPPPAPLPVQPAPGPAARPAPTDARGTSHTVVGGEHLWGIARDHLASVRGVGPASLDTAEIARHWVRVVEVNRGTIRSGDPDLIHPGERLVLPPVDG